MRRLGALALLVAIAWWVRNLGGEDPASAGTALALGFALIAAALAGDLSERVRLPRITGYLVFGMVCGPYVANLITRPMARDLQVVNGLAIALIALIAGLELNLARLRPRFRAIGSIGAATLVVVFVGLFAALWVAWPWLPVWPDAAGLARVAAAAVVATLVVSFSPTVTIAVIADSRARGPLSELVLSIVVLADLALIVGFTLVLQFARWALGEAAGGEAPLAARLAWEVFGSFAFGAIVGALFALYLRTVGREITIVLLGVCVVLSQVGAALHFEPLLAALAAGLVVENIAPPRGDALKAAIEKGALPVLVVFFAAAGTSLHLDALATVGLAAVALAGLRLVLIRSGTALGSRRLEGAEASQGSLVWMGLVSQAGVTLGLTIIVAGEFPEWGAAVQTLLVAMIALHELAGPVLFRAALARAGEIGQMDAGDPRDRAPDLVPARAPGAR